MNTTAGWDAFDGQKYLSLETYRKSGAGVRTAVWFAADAAGSFFYVYSTAMSGKAKRLRRTSVAKIAPCDSRGRVTGPWISAQATLVGEPSFTAGMQLLNRKYRPWKQILDIFVLLFARHERVMIAIRPA
jgi:PPOX class probable F420-dependent enzyme